MTSAPRVTAIIVNFNGSEHLPECLRSIEALDYPGDRLDVLLVDNGSTDGSLAWAREHFPRVRALELGTNLGFADAANHGAVEAQGEILAFLNTDTRVAPSWLRELVVPLVADPNVAAAASCMVDWDGGALDFPVYALLLGMPYASGAARPYRRPADYARPEPLLFASGGGMIVRRQAFLDAGGFDGDYFMYHEDVDLGWRLWILGHRVEYVPAAVVYHRLGGSSDTIAGSLHFLNERNALYTVIKNAGDEWLARLLPLLLLWLIERVGLYMNVDPAAYPPRAGAAIPTVPSSVPQGVPAAIAAVMDVIRHLPRLLEKRASIQARRVRSDEEIAALFDLPREAFLQMMLGADVDFRAALPLLDLLGLGAAEQGIMGQSLRALARADGGAGRAERVQTLFTYLADHTAAEAEEQFGVEPLRRLSEQTGLSARDLSLLSRVLSVVGSKVLAGICPSPWLGDTGADALPSTDGLLRLMRDAVWRDALFYREELAKRTDQVLDALRRYRVDLEHILAREATWSAEQTRLLAENSSLRTLAHNLSAQVQDAERTLEARDRQLEARMREHQEVLRERDRQLEARMREHQEVLQERDRQLEARAREHQEALQVRDQRLQGWRSREESWMNERRSLTAQVEAARVTQERLATTLAEVRRSKRYRLGQTLAVSWWLLLHPAYVAARAREETWQWARTILPLPAKRWIKRSVLRRPQAPWSGPAAAPSGRPAVSQAPGAMPALQPGAPHLEPMARAPKRTPSDLIVFSIIDWHFRFQRSQQLSCQFADHGHRVFYVSITFEEPDSPAAAGLSPRLTPIRPHVHEIHLRAPASLSVYRDRLTPELADLWADAFDRLRAEQDVVDAVCLVQLPFWRPIALRLRERFGWTLVYDCMDRHSGFSTNDPAMLDEEEALTRDSDLVIATARLLYDEHRALNPRCVLVPNATDYAHFSAFVGEPPDWLQRLRRPIIGYYGAIADWFDTVLVGTLARLRPEWSFVLVGSTFTADLRPLEGLPNVHLPGEQPYSRLPAFLHSFDVCLIPFKRLPLTDATNPVKFYEYLSAGKPVVAVSLPELSPYEPDGLVTLADDAPEFAERIEQALATDSPAAMGRRRRFAEQHTWTARFHQIDQAVRECVPRASIIIPTHNNLHLTRLCLEGIFRNTSWPNYEIVVVDNASSDETPAYLRDLETRVPTVRCLFNDRNEGYARANNQGLSMARGEYLVLLNNDTIVTRGWLSTMIRHLRAHADVGMIGPATNLAGNEAKINVDYANADELEAFAEAYTREHASDILEPAMLGFFCVVIPRQVLTEVGGLDERFGIGMFEDDDFSLRVRRAGYRLVCTDGAFVHHFHSATMRRFGEEEYLKLFEVNRKKFEEKWNIRWTPHRYRWQH